MNKRKKTVLGISLIILTLIIVFSSPFQQFASIPGEIRVFEDQWESFDFSRPVIGSYLTSNPNVLKAESVNGKGNLHANTPVQLKKKAGEAKLQLRWGNIPLKSVKVSVLPKLELFPGGESLGVKLKTAGVMVVGHHLVETKGEKISPAEKAGIKVGDLIIKINGIYIHDMKDVSQIVHEEGKKGKDVEIVIMRGDEKKHVSITPAFDAKDEKYRLGVYIRDESAGIGTLTFYEPKTKIFGALGHVISDVDTGKPIVVGDGYIVQADVSSIEKGVNGSPGEKLASFRKEKLGEITGNTSFGIFGKMKKTPDLRQKKLMPVALSEQVKEGPAKILTVLDGQKIESFNIEIVNVIQQRYPATKGMVIKVTDPRLLEKTGGIVQGMSGSPIIQDGKIVGAVTHVFVNDPTSGYGAFIEWMLKDAGIDIEKQTDQTIQTRLKAG